MEIIGYTDQCTTCNKCGKTNLKGTYVVIDENNNDHYYGSECVKKTTGKLAPNLVRSKNDLKKQIELKAHEIALDYNLLNPDTYDDVYKKQILIISENNKLLFIN